MIAKIRSIVPAGFSGAIVEVEGDKNRGLPSFNIVGMANKTVNEARDRVRSAIINSDFSFPDDKITINLAPADLLKDGTYLDLPIALSVLLLSEQLSSKDVHDRIFVGELSLKGTLRPIHGIINIVETAKAKGYQEVFLPLDNLPQAALVPGIKLIGISSLRELFQILKGQIAPTAPPPRVVNKTRTDTTSPTLADIKGQSLAKRALTIAIAGHHNILISGPPGAGKTMLARAATALLPDLTPEEQIPLTKLYSLLSADHAIITSRPFRAPHHSASPVAILGGGSPVVPGEISLAHLGVLFLDELPEYPRSVLESLRQPLEDREITIARAHSRATFPADFMLVATMNPCPCGFLGDPDHACTCTTAEIKSYQKKLSGPLLDRLDLLISVQKVPPESLTISNRKIAKTALKTSENPKNPTPNSPKSTQKQPKKDTHLEPTATFSQVSQKQPKKDTHLEPTLDSPQTAQELTLLKRRVATAIDRQRLRYNQPGIFNSSLSSTKIAEYLKIHPDAEALLRSAAKNLNLSARSFYKIVKVAQTIADLESAPEIQPNHISEALSYRLDNRPSGLF